MKIAIYGATGSVGSQVVSEAVQRGHAVTGLSRRDPGHAAEGAIAPGVRLVDEIESPTHRRQRFTIAN